MVLLEHGGAVMADLVDFEREVLCGGADGASGLEERACDFAAGW